MTGSRSEGLVHCAAGHNGGGGIVWRYPCNHMVGIHRRLATGTVIGTAGVRVCTNSSNKGLAMRILRINNRYFVAHSERELYDAALKVLNECRVFMDDSYPKGEREYVSMICDEMDGENALVYLDKRRDIELIAPEVI